MKAELTQQTGELVALVREGRIAAFVDRATLLPPVDVADALLELTLPERTSLVGQLPARLAVHALLEMPADARPERILVDLGAPRAALLVGELPDDDAAGLLSRLSSEECAALLACVANAGTLKRLLAHDKRTAAGLMTAQLVAVSEGDTIGLAVEAVRRQAVTIGDFSEVFVVDAERRLRGVLSVKQLLLAAPASLVRDVMSHGTVHVGPDEDHQLVARVIARYNLTSVPVIEPGGRLLGRVTADDVRDVAIDEATDDLLRFGGVSVGKGFDSAWSGAVRSRLPWLYTNLLPAFGAAAVVYFFKGSIARIITLAVWMPVVAGVGGNAGTQALATSVRRLILHPTGARGLRALIAREAATGMVNGISIGAVVGTMAVLLGESWKFGLVVAIAMAANLALAAMTGAALPVVLRRLGRDPALASPVLVTAVTDATGFALLLGLASAVLL